MFRLPAVVTAFALVAVAGLAHGLVTSRWQRSTALDAALARVSRVPLTVGDWHGRDLEADPEPFAQARAEAYWVRRYENAAKGQAVTVILMCGRSGPLAVHTPDVCYRGAGYEMAGPAVSIPVPVAGAAEPGRLWTGRFEKEQPGAVGQLRLFWTWSADGTWQAPTSPRLTFAGRPALYKLYVLRETATEEPLAGDPTLAFLEQLLPALNQALFPDTDS
jgi:hypothetical protein